MVAKLDSDARGLGLSPVGLILSRMLSQDSLPMGNACLYEGVLV